MARFTTSRTPQQYYGYMPSPTYGSFTDEASQKPPMKRSKPITDSMEEPSRPTRLEKAEYDIFVDRINIFEALANSTVPNALLIKDALVTGHSYNLLAIATVETQWGSKFIWRLKDADEDTPPLEVYGTKTLARYVTKNDQLNPVMVNCLKAYRINYHGYLADEHFGVSKYQFTISR